MNRMLDAAWVIARRDFVATVFSKTFILFLLAPMMALGFGALIAGMTSEADIEAQQPVVAVIADSETALALKTAHDRLMEPLGRTDLPDLQLIEGIEDDVRAQARALLANPDTNLSAVFTGTLEKPALTGPREASERVGRKVALLVETARNARALDAAQANPPPIRIERVTTELSSGSLNMVRYGLARAGQSLIFFLTLILAGMLLSNLVEEKSNKVIEVLAAAVPLDAVFFGKLIAMLGVSLVGIVIWGALAAAGIFYVSSFISAPVTPALGWPLYGLLLILYFIANFMLLGAVFLGIGGQASNVREVQTLSMPITFAQVGIFLLASAVVGDNGGTLTWFGAIFPLSSPLTMIAIGAQSDAVLPHVAALVWQTLWVWIIIRISAKLFRITVLKSGSGGSLLPRLGRSATAKPAEESGGA